MTTSEDQDEHVHIRRFDRIFHDRRHNVRARSITLPFTSVIETPLNAFAIRADLDQVAPVRAARSGYSMFAYGNLIYLILHKWT